MKYLILTLIPMFMYTSFSQSKFIPPATPQKPFMYEIHNFKITDPYQWLEDKNNPETLEWSKSQHNYTVDYIKTNTPTVSGLRDEITQIVDRDYEGAPFLVGEREFLYTKKKGEQQSKLYSNINGKRILIFDPLSIDESGKSAITGVAFTKDGNKAAIGTQFKGDEISTYRIVDTKTGKILGESITGLSGFSWTKDEKHAYITVRTKEMIQNQEPLKTYIHTIGAARSTDKFIVAPKDAKDFAGIWDERFEDVSFISEGDFYSNSLKIKKINSNDDWKEIYSSKKYKSDVTAKNGKLYFFTNDNAPNYKLMVTDLNKPEYKNWVDLIPEQETVMDGYVLTSDYILVQDIKDVLSRIMVYDLNGKFIKQLEIPEVGNIAGLGYHFESNTVTVTLSTFTSPAKVYHLDGKKLTWKLHWQDKFNIDTKNIETKQVFYTSKDGTRVPMFLVYRNDIKLDANNPTLLYGYGGFNINLTPSFLGSTLSFIKRGGVYAVANLRGGAEYGEKWHQGGMLLNKQNVFDDFIAAAEYLISEKYTNPNKLAIKGGSNGGLLTGAVSIQRPDLMKAAIVAVPLLDMLRFHKFLIARYWIPEYGDPDKKEDFLNILKYSPYQNIKSGFNYPAMMVKAGENDSRVDPLHAKKFAAALQNNLGQENPIMLFVDFDSGHGSGQSTEQMIDNTELEWRFLMWQLGVK
ncbi:MAG TPA: prolyl oligopeptidase family serine peptidase [Candidatus Kapabacteria bacterium]|nr:prolyl oligopeptidase family serine peptidase [Candidatus Kapabacteria bacterium]